MANSFVVDANLHGIALTRLLDVRDDLRVHGRVDEGRRPAPQGQERPVLEGSDVLAVGVAYASSNQPSRRYYLPQYRIATDASDKPRVSLRYQPGDTEIGRLSLALTWAPLTDPTASGVTMVVMDHVAALTLRTRVPVEGGAGGIEQTIPLQPLVMTGPQLAESTTVFTDRQQFEAVYLALREASRGTSLHVAISADVAVRTWRQHVVGRPSVEIQAAALQTRGALFTATAAKAAELDVPERKLEMEVMRASLLASPAHSPMLAMPMVAMAARAATMPAPEPAPAPQPEPEPPSRPAPHGPAAFAAVAHARAGMMPAGVMAAAARMSAREARARTDVAEPAEPITPDPPPPPPATPTRPMTRPMPVALTELRPDLAATTKLHAIPIAEAVQKSDLNFDGIAAVPAILALDEKRRPALVDTRLECALDLPFSFDPAQPRNDAVYLDAGFSGVGIHILRRMVLDGQRIAFRDSLMPDTVLLPPSEFRLYRTDNAPHLPSLSFVASDFATVEGQTDGGAETIRAMLRVAMVYRLVPWIDPLLDDLVRNELAREGIVPQLSVLLPRSVKFSLQRTELGGAQQRTTASVDPDVGITDTLELDGDVFLALWGATLAPQGASLQGVVEYELFDQQTYPIPARLSLRESSPQVFQVDFAGAIDPAAGRYQIAVRNRAECPVILTELPGVELAPGIVAHAVDPHNHTGQTLAPNELRMIEYRVQPPEAAVLSFRPVIVGTPVPDPNELFRLLAITSGATTGGFSVHLRAAAGAFTPRAGAPALSGLLVEFDDGTRVTLTPSAPERDVGLVGHFLDRLAGRPDDQQRYLFRVTNLHADGEGARTTWSERHGAGVLEVGTASGAMDF